jgi:hypothetical protein
MDLVLFDKSGHQLNTQEVNGKLSTRILFERTSSGTQRTESYYLLQKVKGFELTDTFDLKEIVHVNDDTIQFIPRDNSSRIVPITNITPLNTSQEYYTKWISGQGIDRYFTKGTAVYIDNVLGNPDFDNTNTTKKVFIVLATRRDGILVATQTPNNIPITPINFSNGTVKAIPTICNNTLYSTSFNSWDILNDVYQNKPVSISNSNRNDGVYKLEYPFIEYLYRQESIITGNTFFTLNPNDKIDVYVTDLSNTANIDTNGDGIPDTQQPIVYSSSVVLSSSIIGSFVELKNNLQPIIGSDYTIKVDASGFHIKSNVPSHRFKLEVFRNDSPIAVQDRTYISYLLGVNRQLLAETCNLSSDIGERVLVVNSVGAVFRIRLNNIVYGVNFAGSVSATLTSWVSTHGANIATTEGINVYTVGNRLNFYSGSHEIAGFNLDLIQDTGTSGYFLFARILFDAIDEFLTIRIDDVEYTSQFNININTTLQDWFNTHNAALNSIGITPIVTVNQLELYVNDLENTFSNTVNAGIKGAFRYENFDFRDKINVAISSSELISPALNALPISVGQSIALSEMTFGVNNNNYKVLDVVTDKIVLSYEGAIITEMGSNMKLTARDSFRYPRYGYNNTLSGKLRVRIVHDEDDELESPFSIIDLSGENLETSGDFAYTGPKPLWIQPINCDELPTLNFNPLPNRDITKVNDPKFQQTVFKQVEFPLPNIDELTDLTLTPKPIQLHVTFRSSIEGVHQANYILELVRDTDFTIITNPSDISPTILVIDENSIRLYGDNAPSFINAGLLKDMVVVLTGIDNTNQVYKSPFANNGLRIKITSVSARVLAFIPLDDVSVIEESSLRVFTPPVAPFVPVNTGMTIFLSIEPTPVAELEILAETEIEDERYLVGLENLGLKLSSKELPIFESYPLKEQGTDWVFLNAKRKQLLSYYSEIWNYIGSYRSLIDAIRFFDWDKLKVKEYYRNVREGSERFGELFPIDLQNMLDPTIDGWITNNLLSANNKDYQKTDMLGLVFPWTDMEGNFVLENSLSDTFTKLNKLELWLKTNIIPLGISILDIRAEAFLKNDISIYLSSNQYINYYSNETTVNIPEINFTAVLLGINTYKTNVISDIECERSEDTVNRTSNWSCIITIDNPDEFYTVEVQTFNRINNNLMLHQSNQYVNKNNIQISVDEVIDGIIKVIYRNEKISKVRTFELN